MAQGWDITNDPLEKRRPWHTTPPKIVSLPLSCCALVCYLEW